MFLCFFNDKSMDFNKELQAISDHSTERFDSKWNLHTVNHQRIYTGGFQSSQRASKRCFVLFTSRLTLTTVNSNCLLIWCILITRHLFTPLLTNPPNSPKPLLVEVLCYMLAWLVIRPYGLCCIVNSLFEQKCIRVLFRKMLVSRSRVLRVASTYEKTVVPLKANPKKKVWL